MIKSIKVRLKPTKEQETLMFKSCGIARFTYNWGRAKWEDAYKQGQNPSKTIIRKEFNNVLKKDINYQWIKEVSAQVTSQAFEDLNTAYKNFFKGLSNYPKFKTKKNSKQSFYVRYDAIKFQDNKVNLEKIGKVKYKTNYNIPNLPKYNNPRCYFDGKYWYLTFGFEHNETKVGLNKDLSIGIDLGIKDLAICSNGMTFKNINKTKKVKKTEKKLKRLQKQVNRKYENNKIKKESENCYQLNKTNNMIKLEKQIKLVYRKLTNIRNNHLHQATNMIVKTKPSRVVMETLDIKGMMKNKHLSKAIAEQCLYEFKRQMQYKCEFNGIEFVEADKWYPSSKTCSGCGHIKKELKLSDRVYICEECGCVIDRDYNASINLSRYRLVI